MSSEWFYEEKKITELLKWKKGYSTQVFMNFISSLDLLKLNYFDFIDSD